MEVTERMELEDIRDLRVRTDQDYTRQKLKGVLVGGYSKKAVDEIVGELKAAEQQTRGTLSLRIGELTQQLDAAKAEIDRQAAVASQLTEEKSRLAAQLDQSRAENAALRERTDEAMRTCSKMEENCTAYEARLKENEEQFALLEEARGLTEENRALQSQYEEAAAEHERFSRENAVLTLRINELTKRNEELSRQNGALSRQAAEFNAVVRSFRLAAQGGAGEYTEKQAYLVSGITGLMQNALQALDAMKKNLEEYHGGLLAQTEKLPH